MREFGGRAHAQDPPTQPASADRGGRWPDRRAKARSHFPADLGACAQRERLRAHPGAQDQSQRAAVPRGCTARPLGQPRRAQAGRVRRHLAARRRRHGHRVPGRATADRQDRRHQGAQAGDRRRHRQRAGAAGRGARGQLHPPRGHRRHLQLRLHPRRPPLRGDGAARGRVPRRGAARHGALPGARDHRSPRADAQRARRRALRGRHPPRPQAGQHSPRPAQGRLVAGEDPRLRAGQADRAGREQHAPDPGQRGARHARVHVAGAGARPARQPAHRSLRRRA